MQRKLSESCKSVEDYCVKIEKSVRVINIRKIEIWNQKRDVTIRLVEGNEHMRAACDLINERYAWRGYGSKHRIPLNPQHITFTAEIEDEVVGTITLAVDSLKGLAVDAAFKDEIDGFRALPSTHVCELTKFAFSSTIQSKELMAALFHIVFVYGWRSHGCTDLFIEVNPRHVRFYKAMLGFEPVGDLQLNQSVGAPAQLMWLKVAAVRENINRFGGSADSSNVRSLYPFFFSPEAESGIYERLARAQPKFLQRADNVHTRSLSKSPVNDRHETAPTSPFLEMTASA